MRPALRWPVLAIILLAALAGGLTLGLLATNRSVPSSLEPLDRKATILPQAATYDAAQTVTLQAVVTQDIPLVLRAEGTITNLECGQHSTWTSGDIVASVNERQVPAIHIPFPPWRDLAPGAQGDDVAAVQAELARLGQPVPVTGELTAADVASFGDHFGRELIVDGAISLGSFIWLPNENVQIETCDTYLGQSVSGETVVAKAPGSLQEIGLIGLDERADNSSPLQLNLGQVSVPVESSLTINDPAYLSQIEATPEYQVWRTAGSTSDLTATVRLRDPQAVIEVPASSVLVNGDRTCIIVNGEPQTVTVVASVLGRTLIADGVEFGEVTVFPGGDRRCE